MAFKDFFFAMSPSEREEFAVRCGTTRAQLTQVAYGNNAVELGLADVICAVAGHRVRIVDLPLTPKAARQHAIRTSVVAQQPP